MKLRRFKILKENILGQEAILDEPQEILSLADDLPPCVAPQGLLILSGLLQKQKKEVVGVFMRRGFAAIDSRKSKGWASLVLKRINAP